MSDQSREQKVFEGLLANPYHKSMGSYDEGAKPLGDSLDEWNSDEERVVRYDIGANPISDKIRSTAKHFFKGSKHFGLAGATAVHVIAEGAETIIVDDMSEVDFLLLDSKTVGLSKDGRKVVRRLERINSVDDLINDVEVLQAKGYYNNVDHRVITQQLERIKTFSDEMTRSYKDWKQEKDN